MYRLYQLETEGKTQIIPDLLLIVHYGVVHVGLLRVKVLRIKERKYQTSLPFMTNFFVDLNARRSVVEPLGDNASLSSIMYTAFMNYTKQTNKHRSTNKNILGVKKRCEIISCYQMLFK